MKDERLGDEATSFFSVCLGAILLIILVALAVYGHVRKNQFIARCTESTIATVSYESVEPYLYAPYHGGEVQTKYKTHVTYSFTVDEYTHSINYAFEGTVNNYPNVIDVIYNPDNPNEFWYDDTVFDNM